MVIAFRTSTPIALALLPYQAWVATAATLSYQYSRIN
jgi:tryptophan-rich sensory protein